MIDLEQPSLPSCLVVDGRDVRIDTSFRAWLRWGRLAEELGILSPHVLLDEPHGDWTAAALEFYRSENATPRRTRQAGERAIDLVRDGDYIVGSFQNAYGIDLTEGDMHWHRFLALLRSLPEDAKLSQIAGWRSYRRRKTTHEALMRELRDEWALPREAVEREATGRASEFLDANEARAREILAERGGGDDYRHRAD